MRSLRDVRPAFRLRPGLSVAPDGSTVLYGSDAGGSYGLWSAPLSGGDDGGAPVWNMPGWIVRTGVWTPDGGGIVAAADRGGDERTQLFLLDLDAAVTAHRLTTDAAARHVPGAEPVSPDGRVLAYGTDGVRTGHQDLVLEDLRDGGRVVVPAPGPSLVPMRWSREATRLAVMAPESATHQRLLVVERDGGVLATIALSRSDGRPARCIPGAFAAGGDAVWVLSDADGLTLALVLVALDGRVLRRLPAPAGEIESADIAPDGSWAVVASNVLGGSTLHVMRLPDGTPMPAPSTGVGVVRSVTASPTSTAACWIAEGPSTSPTIEGVTIGDTTVRTLVRTARPYYGPVEDAVVRHITFPALDGRVVPAWLMTPSRGARAPVVVSIHGGPQMQERPEYAYSGLYRFLLGQGIAILAPNIRGSSGYGREWQELINRDWGGGDVADLVAARDHIVATPDLDHERIGLFGMSYGGFCVLSCLTQHPDLWRAAVSFMGPADLATFVENVPATWHTRMRNLVGDPIKDRALLADRSPVTHVGRMRAPLYVVQGGRDRRVPREQSDSFVAAARAAGAEVAYDVFDYEGHLFADPENELVALERAAAFLRRHLEPPANGHHEEEHLAAT